MPPISTMNYHQLLTLLRSKPAVFMMIGNGTKNQFRSIPSLRKAIYQFLTAFVPPNSAFLYFGDAPNPRKPDIGYAFELLHQLRPDIDIVMIQISEAKSWGIPSFVSQVYWHNDYTKACKWGGLDTNRQPCSNTKKWVSIAKQVGIDRILVLGGGVITMDEMRLARQLKVPYTYVPLERKFLGDGSTRVKDSDSKKDRIGPTYRKN